VLSLILSFLYQQDLNTQNILNKSFKSEKKDYKELKEVFKEGCPGFLSTMIDKQFTLGHIIIARGNLFKKFMTR